MKTFQRLLGCAVAAAVLSFATGLQAASTTSAEKWLNDYYKNPTPDRFASSILELSDSGYFEQQGNVPLAIGFIASVFAAHPNRVDEWMDLTRNLPEAHQRILVAALWYSGNEKGSTYLRRFARDSNPALRDEIRARLAQAPNLQNAEVRSPSSLNLQWGVFLATGEKAPVESILAALAVNDNARLSQEVRWSLAQNAAQHQRVLAICRDELSRQPNAVRETLRAVINESEVHQPSS